MEMIKKFMQEEDGVTAIEYGLIAALIAVVIIGAVTVVGTQLKAKFNESLHPSAVATVYGWWQACKELDLSGHDPFSANGANLNLLVPNDDADPISASVAHRGQRCRVIKLS